MNKPKGKPIEVAEVVKAAIKADGRNQCEIADACPTLSRWSLNHFIHGRSALSMPKLSELMNVLGLEITKA